MNKNSCLWYQLYKQLPKEISHIGLKYGLKCITSKTLLSIQTAPHSSIWIQCWCQIWVTRKFICYTFQTQKSCVIFHLTTYLKFGHFLKRPQKFETSFHLICHLLNRCQIKWKIVSNFVAFLEKLNFNYLFRIFSTGN